MMRSVAFVDGGSVAAVRDGGWAPTNGAEANDRHVRMVAIECSDAVRQAMAAFGRTEDLALAPGSGHLAIAMFSADALGIVAYRLDTSSHRLVVESASVVHHPMLREPHGLTFLDARTAVVANRGSELLLVELDVERSVIESCRVLVDGTAPVPVRTPGSVAAREVSSGLFEVVVCNNFAHDVTRYLVDRDADWTVVHAERLLAHGLQIPDGLALCPGGEWLAISNHDVHQVYLYRNTVDLDVGSEPDGVLLGANFPHGLEFSADGTRLYLADAGLPYIYEYAAPEVDWSGERWPTSTVRVKDDASFNLARSNPQEGGPKGVTVDRKGNVFVTGDLLPLSCLRTDGQVGSDPGRAQAGPTIRRLAAAAERDRAVAERHRAAAEREHADVVRLATEAEALVAERTELRHALTIAVGDGAAANAARADALGLLDDALARATELDDRASLAEAHLATIERTRLWRARQRLLPVLGPLARLIRRF